MAINPFGAAGYVTTRLLPRDGNGAILRQYQDSGIDRLIAGATYTANGTTLPNIFCIEVMKLPTTSGTLVLTGNNLSTGGTPGATLTYNFDELPLNSLIYGDFSIVNASTIIAGVFTLYKKLLP